MQDVIPLFIPEQLLQILLRLPNLYKMTTESVCTHAKDRLLCPRIWIWVDQC